MAYTLEEQMAFLVEAQKKLDEMDKDPSYSHLPGESDDDYLKRMGVQDITYERAGRGLIISGMGGDAKAGTHDFSGGCAPGQIGNNTAFKNFSVGCFQWLPKKSGGVKRSAAKVRVLGAITEAEKIYALAKELCLKMDDGWIPEKKVYRIE